MVFRPKPNIRELINAVERAVILCRDNQVRPEDFALTLGGTLLADSLNATLADSTSLEESSAAEDDNYAPRSLGEIQKMERDFLADALQRHNWATDVVAQEVGLTPAALVKKIKEHQLQK
jgi:DNA-binding NtrC family response regulator